MGLSMIIRVLPQQIPTVWEVVKFAALRSDEVAPENFQTFCTGLLHKLMNGKMQCWLRLDESRTVLSVQLTEIQSNGPLGIKELVVLGLYSFKLIQDEDAREMHQMWTAFARTTGCQRIVAYSKAPRVWEMLQVMGWTPSHRQFTYKVEA